MNSCSLFFQRECLMVLQEGVSTAADIDRVFKEQYGAKDGPCHLMDLVGRPSLRL